MKITYYGHSCFGVEVGGKNLLFDPFITPNELAIGVDIEKIPADYILITHGHADHVADVEPIAKRTGAQIIGCYELVEWFAATKGVENRHPMNIGGQAKFDFGTVKYVTAVHSSTLPDGSAGGAAGGFIVRTSEGNFYYAGDTALTLDMKLIGEREQLKFSFLPIGDNFTMGIEDAVTASEFINCKEVIGMHYDTFPYIVLDKEQAKDAFDKAGGKLHLMEVGASLDL